MRAFAVCAFLVVAFGACAWAAYGGWSSACAAVAGQGDAPAGVCNWPGASEPMSAFEVLVQAWGTLAAAAFAALAALWASDQTARQFQDQERARTEERRLSVARVLFSEVQLLPLPLAHLLQSIFNYISGQAGAAASEDQSRALRIKSSRLAPLIPHAGVYDGLVAELGLLHPSSVNAVAKFYAQARRLKLDVEDETGGDAPAAVQSAALGYLVIRMTEALAALEDELKRGGGESPLSSDELAEIGRMRRNALALHELLRGNGNSMGLGGAKFLEAMAAVEARWGPFAATE